MLPLKWDTNSTSAMRDVLEKVMPAPENIPRKKSSYTKLCNASPTGKDFLNMGYTPGEPQLVEGQPEDIIELSVHMRLPDEVANGEAVLQVLEPCAGNNTYVDAMRAIWGEKVRVTTNDINAGKATKLHLDITQPGQLSKLADASRADIVVTSPFFYTADLTLPLLCSRFEIVCALMPGHWLSNPTPARRLFLRRMARAGRVRAISVSKPPINGPRNVWIVLGQNRTALDNLFPLKRGDAVPVAFQWCVSNESSATLKGALSAGLEYGSMPRDVTAEGLAGVLKSARAHPLLGSELEIDVHLMPGISNCEKKTVAKAVSHYPQCLQTNFTDYNLFVAPPRDMANEVLLSIASHYTGSGCVLALVEDAGRTELDGVRGIYTKLSSWGMSSDVLDGGNSSTGAELWALHRDSLKFTNKALLLHWRLACASPSYLTKAMDLGIDLGLDITKRELKRLTGTFGDIDCVPCGTQKTTADPVNRHRGSGNGVESPPTEAEAEEPESAARPSRLVFTVDGIAGVSPMGRRRELNALAAVESSSGYKLARGTRDLKASTAVAFLEHIKERVLAEHVTADRNGHVCSDFKGIVEIRADGGRSFDCNEVSAWAKSNGILLTIGQPTVHECQARCERAIQELEKKCRTQLLASGAPVNLWPYALSHAADIMNVTPCVSNGPRWLPPCMKCFGRVPSYAKLRMWGSPGYCYLDASQRKPAIDFHNNTPDPSPPRAHGRLEPTPEVTDSSPTSQHLHWRARRCRFIGFSDPIRMVPRVMLDDGSVHKVGRGIRFVENAPAVLKRWLGSDSAAEEIVRIVHRQFHELEGSKLHEHDSPEMTLGKAVKNAHIKVWRNGAWRYGQVMRTESTSIFVKFRDEAEQVSFELGSDDCPLIEWRVGGKKGNYQRRDDVLVQSNSGRIFKSIDCHLPSLRIHDIGVMAEDDGEICAVVSISDQLYTNTPSWCHVDALLDGHGAEKRPLVFSKLADFLDGSDSARIFPFHPIFGRCKASVVLNEKAYGTKIESICIGYDAAAAEGKCYKLVSKHGLLFDCLESDTHELTERKSGPTLDLPPGLHNANNADAEPSGGSFDPVNAGTIRNLISAQAERPDFGEIAKAAIKEIKQTRDTETLEPCTKTDVPAGEKPIKIKLIWKVSLDHEASSTSTQPVYKYKCRAVVQGFLEDFGGSHMNASVAVANKSSVRLVINYSLLEGMQSEELDVSGAF